MGAPTGDAESMGGNIGGSSALKAQEIRRYRPAIRLGAGPSDGSRFEKIRAALR